jgi:hypothetical protein
MKKIPSHPFQIVFTFLLNIALSKDSNRLPLDMVGTLHDQLYLHLLINFSYLLQKDRVTLLGKFVARPIEGPEDSFFGGNVYILYVTDLA